MIQIWGVGLAGKHHHHVWQMLQRGFSTLEFGKNHIWVYRKDHEPKKTVTSKFGREKFFFGQEGSAADKNISDFENSVSELIHVARSAPAGSELDRDIVAPLVSHLEMRSLFLRAEMSRIGERAIEIIREQLSSEKHVKDVFSAIERNHPEFLREAIDGSDIPADMRDAATALAASMSPSAVSDGAGEVARFVDELFAPNILNLAEMAKDAHNRSLESNFSDVERTEQHRQLEYRVFRIDKGEIILPDTSLAILKKNGCSPVSQKGDDIERIIIPVSNQVAIVGGRDDIWILERGLVNRVLASCAFEAFVARQRSDEFQGLSRRISKNARLMSDAELKRAVSFREMLKS